MCQIRVGNKEDLEHIITLCCHSIQQVNCADYNTLQIKLWSDSVSNPEKWEELFEDEDVFLAEINGEVCGVATIRFDGNLNMLYVHPDHLRKGIATKLLNHVFEFAAHEGILQIDANVSITAKSFFLAQKFAVKQKQITKIDDVEFVNFKVGKFVSVEQKTEHN